MTHTANGVDISEMMETLVDWLETIEEVSLSDEERQQVAEVAESLTLSRNASFEMGIQAEDFDDWFQLDVLESWSALMEDCDENLNVVEAFHNYIKGGEQRLYLQMMKRCMPVSVSQTA